ENSVFDEPVYKNTYNGDLGAFMGWEQLGKTKDRVPMLKSLLEITKMSMGHKKKGQLSTRELVKAIFDAPVDQLVPSDAYLGSDTSDLVDDKAQQKADAKCVKAFAGLDLSAEDLLEILGKKDSSTTLERIRAALDAVKKSDRKKVVSSDI